MQRLLTTLVALGVGSLSALANNSGAVQQGVDLDFALTGGTYQVTGAVSANGPLDSTALIRFGKPVNSLQATLQVGDVFPQFGLNGEVLLTGVIDGNDQITWTASAPALNGQVVTVTINGLPVQVTLDAANAVTGTIVTTLSDLDPVQFSGASKVFRKVALSEAATAGASLTLTGQTILGGVTLVLNLDFNGIAGNLDLPDDVVIEEQVGSRRSGYWTTDSNGNITGWKGLSRLAPGWDIAATGDMDGDGDHDVLLFNSTTRRYGYWRTEDGMIIGWQSVGLLGAGWFPVAIGDFNLDSKGDVVVRGPATQLGYFETNGMAVTGYKSIFRALAWDVVGLADMDKDNRQDLVVYSPTLGRVGVYLMNGGSITGWRTLVNLRSAFRPVGLGQFNDDAFADLLIRNTATRQLSAYTFNRTNLITWKQVFWYPEDWEPVTVAGF